MSEKCWVLASGEDEARGQAWTVDVLDGTVQLRFHVDEVVKLLVACDNDEVRIAGKNFHFQRDLGSTDFRPRLGEDVFGQVVRLQIGAFTLALPREAGPFASFCVAVKTGVSVNVAARLAWPSAPWGD